MAQDTGLKTFVSSAIHTSTDEEENERTTMIDDLEVTFALPDLNQVVLATSMIESATSNVQAGAALINVFFGLIKPEELRPERGDDDGDDFDDEVRYTHYTARTLETRMFDPKDDFGIEVIAEVMGWLLEEWSNRPTSPSSRSSASPSKRGKTSKAKLRGEGSTPGTTAR